MLIEDPLRLLPPHVLAADEWPDMVLEVPAHGIPVLAASVERLVDAVRRGAPAAVLRPSLPVTSELGLPPYPVLARLYPARMRHLVGEGRLGSSLPFAVVTSEHLEEHLHYYGDHYGAAVGPSYARVIVGNTCNLKCVMCPYHGPDIKPTHTTDFFRDARTMSWERMQVIAEECGRDAIPVLVGSVEEPLLHPRVVDFVALCRERGVPRVHLTTNGVTLEEGVARRLLHAGLTSVDISIDAVEPETYRRVRGARLERVEANVQRLIALRDELRAPCEVRTSFVRNEGVAPEEEARFRERWLERVDGVFVLNVARYEQTNMRLATSNEVVSGALGRYLARARGRWACMFPFVELDFLPDGRVYYCIETLFRLGFDGRVESMAEDESSTLREIWRGEPFRRLRRDLIENRLGGRPSCQGCVMWQSQVMDRSMTQGVVSTATTVTEILQKGRRDHSP